MARRCGLDPSNLSSVANQLTKRGLITSRPAAHDKRVRIVRLSEARQKQLLEILRDVP